MTLTDKPWRVHHRYRDVEATITFTCEDFEDQISVELRIVVDHPKNPVDAVFVREICASFDAAVEGGKRVAEKLIDHLLAAKP
ncbi:hypothetical protein [Pseudomonas sp. NA-150]|uniref:hypothetical protein n=1 Tax=Pseudomonas sp. NA-150 TaxID=3367525 RepID=UPI0037C58551